jgi:hypothetical protein
MFLCALAGNDLSQSGKWRNFRFSAAVPRVGEQFEGATAGGLGPRRRRKSVVDRRPCHKTPASSSSRRLRRDDGDLSAKRTGAECGRSQRHSRPQRGAALIVLRALLNAIFLLPFLAAQNPGCKHVGQGRQFGEQSSGRPLSASSSNRSTGLRHPRRQLMHQLRPFLLDQLSHLVGDF